MATPTRPSPPASSHGVPALRALELAAGRPLGREDRPGGFGAPSLGRRAASSRAGSLGQRVAQPASPLRALEDALVPALTRGPCRVAFSGGRDSSLLLAAALRAARREGLPEPVPVTLRFAADPDAEESAWQEHVLAELRPADWVVVADPADVDLLGPLGAATLRRLGPYYPANAHVLVPMLAGGDGGSLVLGHGGDELLNPPLWQRHNDVLAGRRRPTWRDALRAGVALTPRPARIPWVRRAAGRWLPLAWLTPDAARRYERLALREDNMPVAFAAALRAEAGRRAHTAAAATFDAVVAERGVRVHLPLLEDAFVAALGAAGGRRGFGSRAAAMRAVADGALPDELVTRTTKASFTRSFYGPESRAFAARWTGAPGAARAAPAAAAARPAGPGVPFDLVDADRLRAAWLTGVGDFRAAMLLQAAWLHDEAA